jgi:hypothetical protein
MRLRREMHELELETNAYMLGLVFPRAASAPVSLTTSWLSVDEAR